MLWSKIHCQKILKLKVERDRDEGVALLERVLQPQPHLRPLYEKTFNFNLSGNEVDYTFFSGQDHAV
jgi:hypothetical protein